MREEKPLIVSFIGTLNILGALVAIAVLFPGPFQKLEVYIEPASPFTNSIVKDYLYYPQCKFIKWGNFSLD